MYKKSFIHSVHRFRAIHKSISIYICWFKMYITQTPYLPCSLTGDFSGLGIVRYAKLYTSMFIRELIFLTIAFLKRFGDLLFIVGLRHLFSRYVQLMLLAKIFFLKLKIDRSGFVHQARRVPLVKVIYSQYWRFFEVKLYGIGNTDVFLLWFENRLIELFLLLASLLLRKRCTSLPTWVSCQAQNCMSENWKISINLSYDDPVCSICTLYFT